MLPFLLIILTGLLPVAPAAPEAPSASCLPLAALYLAGRAEYPDSASATAAMKSAESAVQSKKDCRADAVKENDSNNARWGKANAKIAKLIAEKKQALDELASGMYCNRCYRTASEIERQDKTSFQQHLNDVKGVAVPAPASKIREKAQSYNSQVAGVRSEIAGYQKNWSGLNQRYIKCGSELNQAIADYWNAKYAADQLAREEALAAWQEKLRQAEQAERDRLKAAQEKQQAQIEKRRAEAELRRAEQAKVAAEQKKQQEEALAGINARIAASDERIKQMEADLDRWHQQTMDALNKGQEVSAAPPPAPDPLGSDPAAPPSAGADPAATPTTVPTNPTPADGTAPAASPAPTGSETTDTYLTPPATDPAPSSTYTPSAPAPSSAGESNTTGSDGAGLGDKARDYYNTVKKEAGEAWSGVANGPITGPILNKAIDKGVDKIKEAVGEIADPFFSHPSLQIADAGFGLKDGVVDGITGKMASLTKGLLGIKPPDTNTEATPTLTPVQEYYRRDKELNDIALRATGSGKDLDPSFDPNWLTRVRENAKKLKGWREYLNELTEHIKNGIGLIADPNSGNGDN